MKKTPTSKSSHSAPDEMCREYHLDYRKARPNRFAARMKNSGLVVVLDPDISKVFTTANSVNGILRAIIRTMPGVMKT